MDINIRQAIKHNLSDNDNEKLRSTVVDAIEDGQEKMLPGLGVMFEIIWEKASDEDKNKMIDHLAEGV
ncbi:small acid-soluble spore protein SspI [Tuberibacillus sp. Marseille-P3662]|uniref:small acid-soluble spore protein SspI n=1 Tax=Tuberibacillus sp. Marseille-P3662 TaxID=1965358 RepID=UPI000A1CDE53|nr:small acid-soluble spore protein SspI [Tuberibacillus sp. Marseille-P3662]